MEELVVQTREEIEDFIDINSKETVVDYIMNLEKKVVTLDKGLDGIKVLMRDSVPKSRYNALVKKYNSKEEDKKKWIKTL